MESLLFSIDGRKDIAASIILKCDSAILAKKIGALTAESFSDGEQVIFYDETVRGKRVYLLSTPHTDSHIMRLELAIDAAMRAGAKEIIPIIPYFPYARQDKKDQPRGPIGAKVIAKILEVLGATGIITFDFHADQIQGFFDLPVTHIEGKNVFDKYLASLDSGKRVKRFKNQLADNYDIDLDIVMMDKTRKKANEVEKMVIIGDVKGKDVILVDDMVDTGGTLCKGVDVLLEHGAKSVRAVISHGVLSGKAYENIGKSNLTELIISDSLAIDRAKSEFYYADKKIKVISIANQVASAIHAIDYSQSFEELKNAKRD